MGQWNIVYYYLGSRMEKRWKTAGVVLLILLLFFCYRVQGEKVQFLLEPNLRNTEQTLFFFYHCACPSGATNIQSSFSFLIKHLQMLLFCFETWIACTVQGHLLLPFHWFTAAFQNVSTIAIVDMGICTQMEGCYLDILL